MLVSEARLAANRANSAKSTGPKTAEGKERSRGNALKHGMTGEGIALCSEDADLVAQHIAAFEAELRPVTEEGRTLVRRAAIHSVRLDRCVVQEASAISKNVRDAEADFDEARAHQVDELVAKLGEEPGPSVRRLMRMPEGVDRMLAIWAGIGADLAQGDGSRWTADHGTMATRLAGRKATDFGITRVEALANAVAGDFKLLAADDGAGLEPKARRDWARRALAELIDAEMAKLRAHRETLDFEAIAANRAGARTRALFDPSKEATLARKYEAAAERGFYRALRDLKKIEAEAAKQPARPPAPAPAMASFLSPPPPRPAAPVPAPSPTTSGSRIADFEGSTFIPMNIGRPSPGRA